MNLREVKGFLLDMDGTIYLGENPIPGAAEFIEILKKEKKKYIFLTNNSSRNPLYYKDKLAQMGIEAAVEEILTSGEVAARYVRRQGHTRIYALATPSLVDTLENEGLALVEEEPEMVVVGFDTTLTYEKLEKACKFIQRGTPWMATHPDKVCPTEDGFIPDCGAITALLKEATSIEPQVVLGKPHPQMAQTALEKLGLPAEVTAMVGDRLYTDIAMGKKEGMKALLVLSGEASRQDLEKSEVTPHQTFASVLELGRALQEGE